MMYDYDQSKAKPSVLLTHLDGPLLVCTDGSPHWLNIFEYLSLKLRLTNADKLNAKYLLRSYHKEKNRDLG